jgi:4-hydroxybenzoate polyprenyltransferase
MSIQAAPQITTARTQPMALPARLAACMTEARPQVQVIFFLRLLAGAVLGRPAGAMVSVGHLFAVALVWGLAIFSVYLFDGVMDIVEDRLNGSKRPIARGTLPRGFAASVATLAAAAAILGAILLGPLYQVMVPIVLVLGYLYCAPPVRLKRWSITAGGTVAIAGVLTFVAGAASHGSVHAYPALIIFGVVFSLWMGGVGALAKDFSDIEGDAAAGCRNAVLRRHSRGVRLVIGNSLAVAAGFLIAAALAAPVLVWPAIVMIVGAATVAWAAREAQPQASKATRRRPYQAFMLTQYLVHGVVLAYGLLLIR